MMPDTPTTASTQRSSLEEAPLRPRPSSSNPTQSPVASYFSPSHHASTPSSRSTDHRGYATYRPQPSASTRSLQPRSKSATRAGPSSWTGSHSASARPSDNWQGLRNLVTDEEGGEDGDDGSTIHGSFSATPILGGSSGISHRSLRSFFASSAEGAARPIEINESNTREGRNGTPISAATFSSSPPQMDGMAQRQTTIEDRISEEMEPDDREETLASMNGLQSPLLGAKKSPTPSLKSKMRESISLVDGIVTEVQPPARRRRLTYLHDPWPLRSSNVSSPTSSRLSSPLSQLWQGYCRPHPKWMRMEGSLLVQLTLLTWLRPLWSM